MPVRFIPPRPCGTAHSCSFALLFLPSCQPYSGGYSTGVPPLPIPNREVKPGHADGTAQQWESRSPPFFFRSPPQQSCYGGLCFCARRENPYRIPISFMQCSLIRSRSAFWLPHEVLRHILTQCFVEPLYCTSSFFYPVLRCIPSFCFLPFCIKSIFLAKFFSFFFVHVHSFTTFAVYY